MVDVEQVMNLLENDEFTKEDVNPVPANIGKGEIEFKNVTFTYDTKMPLEEQTSVIDNVSFKIEAGTRVGIVGQTGSGKSTIMRLLYRFYELQEGEILVDGTNIKQMKVDDLRHNIAIVPQDCILFNDTIAYNIAYGGLNQDQIR